MKTDKITQLQGWGITVLRVGTGSIFLMSGVQKLFVNGPSGETEFFTQLGSTFALAVVIATTLVELVCGLALVLGLFTRMFSVPLALGMLVDVLLIHSPSEYFMNVNGYEHALLRLAASIALVLTESGKAALDNTLTPRKGSRFTRLLR